MEVTNDFKNLVSDKLNEFAKTNNLKGIDLERKTGIDGAWISLIRNKKYNDEKSPKIQDDKFIVIADFLGIRRQSEVSAGEANRLHFNTDNFIITRRLVELVAEEKTVAILDSDISGAGKTYNTQTICKHHPYYYYYKVSSDCTPSLLINGIMKAIGMGEVKGKISEKLDMIEARLKGKNAVLIVDEVETVEPEKRNRLYGKIKDICDKAIGNFGFIACGIGLLRYFEIQAEKDTKMKGYKQLYSRLSPNSEVLGGISKDDVKEISNKVGGLKEVVMNWILKCVPDFRFLMWKLPEIVEINEANSSVEAIEKKLYGLLSKRTKVDANMRQRFSI